MLPVMTSIQPWLGSLRMTSISRLATWYSAVSVLTRILSPSLTNDGTCTTRPVSSVAGFTCALAVAPLMPGTVSLTSRSTVGGSSMPTGSSS